MLRTRLATAAFTMIEVLIATSVLAICFIPILTNSQASIRETTQSQESLLARHFLVDLVERYRGSPPSELLAFPSAPPSTPLPLGTEPSQITGDPLLNSAQDIYTEMQQQAQLTGFLDAGAAGAQKFVNIQKLVKITREVFCVKGGQVSDAGGPINAFSPYQYTLTCRVRWQPMNQKNENSVQMVTVIIE